MQQAHRARKEILGRKALKETLERGVHKGHRGRREIPGHKGLKAILERLEQKAQQVLRDRREQLLQSVLMGTGI